MEKLIIIRTLEDLKALSLYLEDKEFIAFDTETTGVEKESQIIGFSVSADVDVGYYVIVSYWDVEQQRLRSLETIHAGPFLESLKGKSLIMHNGVFDCAMVENNFGIDLVPSLHTDTLMLGHLLDENRSNGLKELAVTFYGEDSKTEQDEMKASVHANGGVLTKAVYELYKADADLIARYGAKDAILTLKLFYEMVPTLYEQGLDKFFYEDETMPLLRGPTYDLNTTGLRVDAVKLQDLKNTLEAECVEARAFIEKEVAPHVAAKYPGTSKVKTFNINAGAQLAWLLFGELDNDFSTLTKVGRDVCKQALGMDRLPYSLSDKRKFIRLCLDNVGKVYAEPVKNVKTGRMGLAKKVREPWYYIASGKATLAKLAPKYKWVERLLEFKKNEKLLRTYVEGIQDRMKYNIIRPNFLQHGTTSGRYSCKNPNFQNLPRDDKRVKACIVARPGHIFVGADFAQLEPRVFSSFAKDERLLRCFADGDDFYSVVGAPTFGVYDCTLKKDDAPDSFPVKYKKLRDVAKVIALATPYGTTAPQMANEIALKAGLTKSIDECQDIINDYFENYPGVHKLMLDSHEQVKAHGVVYNLFGRPRRVPEALHITRLYGSTPHGELPRQVRNLLNLAMNHPIQSTGASIMNRSAIAAWLMVRALAHEDLAWRSVRIVLQVHDELILEGPEALRDLMIIILKDAMENTVTLPGVALIAEPKAAYNLADLK